MTVPPRRRSSCPSCGMGTVEADLGLCYFCLRLDEFRETLEGQQRRLTRQVIVFTTVVIGIELLLLGLALFVFNVPPWYAALGLVPLLLFGAAAAGVRERPRLALLGAVACGIGSLWGLIGMGQLGGYLWFLAMGFWWYLYKGSTEYLGVRTRIARALAYRDGARAQEAAAPAARSGG